jgi:hypothetical protein
LQKIQASVDGILKDCNNTLMERNIMRKASGPKYKSAIDHTKTKAEQKTRAKGQSETNQGQVYPDRGNKSPIGRAPSTQLEFAKGKGISKSKSQTHPGKPTKDKSQLSFCDLCGAYVTDLAQHQTKTAKHLEGLKRNIKHVDCLQCGHIHPVDACSQKKAE